MVLHRARARAPQNENMGNDCAYELRKVIGSGTKVYLAADRIVHPSVRSKCVGATAQTNYLQNVHAEAEHRNRMHSQLVVAHALTRPPQCAVEHTMCMYGETKTTNRQRQICWRPKLHGRSRHFVRIFHNRVHVVRERTPTHVVRCR